ncbi:hypothetical protein [Pseudanabaena sp. FACHB-2040]|uniref:hypothetical protein n=1 Tax=Pseudanabaena sp. FACHB-2040 TaxID=2692859 RepID=UPI00168A3CA4|nr:hypothetical protein [Pseudanabaena sp. FACHB-2040]MBD2259130.1 hypothetical protein [Pseudanabaena sp. FACHB-2040]
MKLERIGDDMILFCGNIRDVKDEVATAAQAAREAGAKYLTIWPTDAVAIAKGQRPLTMEANLPQKLRDAREAI